MSIRKANIVWVIMLTIHLQFPQSDAASVITTNGSLDEINDLRCGSDVVITCTTQPAPNKVVWTIDNVWVADCTFGICTENSSIPTFYSFIHNDTGGVFHLNIRPVSFQQSGKSFACEEGTGPPYTITTEVSVIPNTSDLILTESNKQLVITTGCVYPVTNITFEWYIYKVGMEAVPYTKQEPVQTFNVSDCSLGDCGHSEAARVSSTLNIPSVEKGELYYFQVIVRHTATSQKNIFYPQNQYRISGTTDLPTTSSHTTSHNTNTTLSTDEIDKKSTPVTDTDTSISQLNKAETNSLEQNRQTQITVLIITGIIVLVIFSSVSFVYILCLTRKYMSCFKCGGKECPLYVLETCKRRN